MTKKNSSERPLRVGLISLGCAKNLVDAEIMLGSLMKSGVVKVPIHKRYRLADAAR